MLTDNHKFFQLFFIVFAISTINSCTYRFTNYYTYVPPTIKTIAFEAIYDTSREVIPHEIIWQELQKRFAENGRLIIADKSSADLLLRVHIHQAAVFQFGAVGQKEPKDPVPYSEDRPIAPKKFRDLSRPWKFAKSERVTLGAEIEIWNLKTQKMLFSRSVNSNRHYTIPEVSRKAIIHLRSEEQKEAAIHVLGRNISDTVINSFVHKL